MLRHGAVWRLVGKLGRGRGSHRCVQCYKYVRKGEVVIIKAGGCLSGLPVTSYRSI